MGVKCKWQKCKVLSTRHSSTHITDSMHTSGSEHTTDGSFNCGTWVRSSSEPDGKPDTAAADTGAGYRVQVQGNFRTGIISLWKISGGDFATPGNPKHTLICTPKLLSGS